MDMSVAAHGPENRTDGKFVTEFDAIPGFWNYLAGLDRNDLIAELIQNDLDQDATRTVISFEEDRLICEGDGRPVEPDGWRRLRKIQGAGDEAPAKHGKIGVKNHGLKTAFTISDELHLMSDGRAIIQTLYANGRDKPPRPGASPEPMDDPRAPANGCHVIVRYRDTDLEPRQGETFKWSAVDSKEIDELFQSACAGVPEQFAGIVSPETAPRYEIVLRHWRLGEARFRFSCTRPRKIDRWIELFQRRCDVDGTVSPLPDVLREQAVRRLVPLKGVLKRREADFFRRGNRFYVEASWPINGRGKPKAGAGRFRYPIGYPDSSEARTGHGARFNAPFISDNKRHGPVRDESTNEDLFAMCESLLVDALARHAIPRWGPDGLNPLVPNSAADDGDAAVRPLLAKLAKQGALPVLSWRDAAELALKGKGKKQAVKAVARRLTARRGPREAKRYRFVIPAPTWANDTVHPALSLLCPRSEMQLDPRVPSDIVRLLTDGKTLGSTKDFITFDENHVFDRVTGEDNQYFGAIADSEREFSEPLVARAYLDLTKLALDNGKCDGDKEDALIEALMLPDVHGRATPLRDLYSSVPLPSGVPGLRLPPILHPGLGAHPLLRRRKWRREKYTMARFLEEGAIQAADEDTRRQFWDWLRRNERQVAPRARPKLADLAIWPDEDGQLHKISDLCDPRSRDVRRVLAGSIRKPHEHVRRSKLVSVGRRARTSIRRAPTGDEIADWLNARLAGFGIGSEPDAATAAALSRFEADVVILLKDAAMARPLKEAEAILPALARDGTIRPRAELVAPNPGNDRLALPGRFLLKDRSRAAALDKLSPALDKPTAAMLLDAFTETPGDVAALQPRLREFLSVTESDSDERRKLAGMLIIPVDGRPRAPSELAFKGNKGDYWGDWKIRISTEGLSQDDQSRYRDAGVTSALPNQKTSRAFFEWLVSQGQDALRQHIPCVLRHILHREGPTSWAESSPDTSFIPTTEGQDGLQLVSLRKATAQRSSVYLSDAGSIGKAVIHKDRAVLLVIDQVKEVKEPISKPLRTLGVRSLREALKEPESVSGTANVRSVDEGIRVQLSRLRSTRFRSTFYKRLSEWDVEPESVRHDWHDRLRKIKDVRYASKIEVSYRFRRKPYLVEATSGFDPGSSVFWIMPGLGDELGSFYESMASQLIFKPETPRHVRLVLKRVLDMEIEERSFGRSAGSISGESDDDIATGDSGDLEYDGDANDGLGEAGSGHSPFTPDPMRNEPRPGPIPNRPSVSRRHSTVRRDSSGSGGNGSGSRTAPAIEKEHIDALKHDHYTSHCQMCLCERPPKELAPTGSYIEWEEVRRHVVEAHHPDLVSAGGARHAGNLILLCKRHHDNYGRQLSRAAVTAALRDGSKERSIDFGEGAPIEGRQIEIGISGTGEPVKLFFTEYHVDYWLKRAPDRSGTA